MKVMEEGKMKKFIKPSETDNFKGTLTQVHLPGETVVHTTLGKYRLDEDGDIVLLIDAGVNEEVVRVRRIK